MVYDPRNAQDLDVIEHPFAQGTTTSLSANIPMSFFGLTGYHTLRASTALPTGTISTTRRTSFAAGKHGEAHETGLQFGSYALQQFLWDDPDNPGRAGASSLRSPPPTPTPIRSETRSSWGSAVRLRGGRTIAGAWRGAIIC